MIKEEAWEELKDTIIELRDNDGTLTQQEVCGYLVHYMNILERQIESDVKIEFEIHR